MKDAEQWIEERTWDPHSGRWLSPSIRAIQADALRHAAKMCRGMEAHDHIDEQLAREFEAQAKQLEKP